MTNGERHLKDLLRVFEEKYFKDLTLRDSSLQKKLLLSPAIGKKDFSKNESDKISKLLSIDFYNVRIRGFDEGIEGSHNANTRTIYLSKHLRNTSDIENTLLHEMLHAYECRIHRAFHYLYQPLLIHKYEDMKKTLGDTKLKRLMLNLPSEVRRPLDGHSLFFWLKSIELDLERGVRPGTVAGFEAPF